MAEQTYNQRYADGDDNTAGAFGFDQVSSVDYAISKVAFGDADTITRVTASAGLPVAILAGSASIGTLGANSGVDIGDVTINNSTGAAAVNIQDGGNSITVDGTVTAELSATDNAVLDTIAASLAGTLTVGLPTGAATAAKQPALGTAGTASSDVITVQGIASMTALKVDGSAVTQPVSGTFWQATQPVSLTSTTVTGTVAVTQSGTWTVDLGATDNAVLDTLATPIATIGTTPLQRVAIFDASNAQITSFGGGVQYTEGDTDASITGTACMWEDTSNTLVATSAAKPLPVEIVAGAGSGGTAAADDADFTPGTTSGTPVMGVYESTPTSVTDGDVGTVGITVNRALKTSAAQSGTWNITNVSGTVSLPTGASTAAKQPALGTAGTASSDVITVQGITSMTPLIVDLGANNDVTVTGTVTANAGTNLNTSLLAVESGGNLASIASTLSGWAKMNGTVDTGVLRVTIASDSTGVLASIGSITSALPAGTNAIGKLAANSGVDIGDVDVTSLPGAAHDSAVSGNPVRVGARAETALSGITLVADGDTTDLYAGVDGVLITRNHTGLEDIVSATPVAITDGSSTSVISAAGSGIKIYVTSVTIANASATFVTVDLRDGTAGSVKWTFPVPATGGVTHTFDPPLAFSANTAVAADPSASASTITVSINGFKSKV